MTDDSTPLPSAAAASPESRIAALEARLAAVQLEKARCALFFERSVMGILLGDPSGNIRDANPRAAEMLGYDIAALRRMNIRELIHPEDQEAVSVNVGIEAARAGKAFKVERRYRCKDGTWLALQVDFSALDERGELFQVMLQDIGRRKAAEEAKDAALAQARAASEAKSAFLANMSHEIRTPLNGVMGMLQLLKATPLSREQGDYLAMALEASGALLRILSDILDFTQMDGGALGFCEKRFSLPEILDPILAAFAHEASAKGLELRLETDPATPRQLLGDAGRVRQILCCLVGNAVKYTDAGRIVLAVRPLEGAAGEVRVMLEFRVTDTGRGIPAALREKVFEPFFQADATLTRRHGGAGMGLALAKGLVGLMGGEIVLEEADGGGLAAVMRLPFARFAADVVPLVRDVMKAAPVAQEATALAGRRILVVDDEAVNRLTLRAILERLGCVAVLAENGRQALARLAAEDFDAVLLDVRLPDHDGYSMARAIRSGEAAVRDPRVPLVAATAHFGPDARRDA
ncbi:MAG TPA: hybrid sensor histidine kinase/response regulator, partial [Desulfovibrio sp.]|nr:hybrid sensor histidine kinase/response regulator [Desulfovibrio sp.]